MRAKHFRTLDGLRGVAAIAVVTRHLPGLFGGYPWLSYLAVDLFFVLSGFVIAHAYEERLRSGMGSAEFMIRRVIRLWPLYALGSLAGLVVRLAAVAVGLASAPTALELAASVAFGALFIPVFTGAMSLDTTHPYPLNFPAWSLFWELVANAGYAALAKALSNRLLSGLIAASALGLIILTASTGGMDYGSLLSTFWGGALRVGFGFFAGVLLYRLWRSGRLRFATHPALLLTALLAVFFVHPPAALEGAIALGLTLLGFPALVLISANSEPTGRLDALCHWFGRVSYPVYVLHAAASPLQRIVPSALAPWGGLALIIVLLLGATLANRLVDDPAQRALKSAIERKRRLALTPS